MDEATIRAKLSRYIAQEIMRDPDYELDDDEPIISGGLMDSFSLAKVGVYCEKEFGVFIPDPDLTVAKMDTLNQMVARVLRDLK
jgi:acyl carrier protein